MKSQHVGFGGVSRAANFTADHNDRVLLPSIYAFDIASPVYIASSIFFGKGMEFGVKWFTITLKGKFVCIVTFYTAMMM